MAYLQRQILKAYTPDDLVRIAKSLEVPKGYVINISLEPEEAEKQAPKVSKWQNFLKEAERVDLSDDTFEHIQACSKEFRESSAFRHDLKDNN